MNLVFFLLGVLTSSAQTKGQSVALSPVLTLPDLPHHPGTSASPDVTEDPGNMVPKWTHNRAGRNETSTETTTGTKTEGTVLAENVTNADFKNRLLSTSSTATTAPSTDAPLTMTPHTGPSSAAAGRLSSTPPPQSATPQNHISTAENRTLQTTDTPTSTFSSQPAHTLQDGSSTALAFSTQPQPESPTTEHPSRTAPSSTRLTHQEVPSELNVGDEDTKGHQYHPSSPLDPLLAGLLSVFIVTTAIIFVVLFLKLRQRTNQPEFHRLQDLPMDDLMEDTPLSRYTY
ncbi:salivary glue protein Sgs-3-like [Echeneis naucrates]|uniref:Salivary glue protein Sgs-3-like n=1 Tax=Echeneis naucrates TaxID=173247 RepID=A0A665V3U8_ECHNA|nr:salivary glue protein Sgs-3-like [Echeneis naucrates]